MSVLKINTCNYCNIIDMAIIIVYFFVNRVKEVIGYDPELLLSKSVRMIDFLHPADLIKIFSVHDRCKCIKCGGVCSTVYPVIIVRDSNRVDIIELYSIKSVHSKSF